MSMSKVSTNNSMEYFYTLTKFSLQYFYDKDSLSHYLRKGLLNHFALNYILQNDPQNMTVIKNLQFITVEIGDRDTFLYNYVKYELS
jgi:hypothetical protein